MNEFIIKSYINKLSIDDLYAYATKEGINLSQNDANLIFKYIKHYWKEFLSDPEYMLENIKTKVDTNVYNKIMELYNKYKKRIIN